MTLKETWLLICLIELNVTHAGMDVQCTSGTVPYLPLAPHTSFLGEYSQWFQMPELLQAEHEQWPVPKHERQGSSGLELISPPEIIRVKMK